MHRKSPKKVKKAILMQRGIKAERHMLIFVAIWRDHVPNPRCCRYLAWTRSCGWLQAAPNPHKLSRFCVITLIWRLIYLASVFLSVITMSIFCRYFAWSRHWVMIGDLILSIFCRLFVDRNRISCRFFAWSRSFGVWSILRQCFWVWSRWAYFVAILRDHATNV